MWCSLLGRLCPAVLWCALVPWCPAVVPCCCAGAQCRGGAERVWCQLLLVLAVGEVPFLRPGLVEQVGLTATRRWSVWSLYLDGDDGGLGSPGQVFE